MNLRALPVILILALAACRDDADRTRAEHADSYPAQLSEHSAALLDDRELDLETCIALALDNGLAVKSSDLARRLARIDRQTAFGAFLPHLELSFTHLDRRHAPTASLPGGAQQQMTDRSVSQFSASIQMPILVPQAFFLYRMFQEGEDIADLIAQRVRQQIALHVAGRFYACQASDRLTTVRSSAAQYAAEVHRQTVALHAAGLATAAAVAEAEALMAAEQHAVANLRRQRRDERAALLEAMGLHPLATISLAEAAPGPDRDLPPLEEAIVEALIARLELRVSDREVAASRHEVRMALVAWLPRLIGFASYDHTSDSRQRYRDNLSYGISGVLTVLDGWRNVHGYQAARMRQRQAFVRREEQTLAVIMEVLRAHQAVTVADEALALAVTALRAASQRHHETEAQWQAGLITAPQRLHSATALHAAQAQHILAGYRRDLAHLLFEDAIGMGATPEVPAHKGDHDDDT